LKQDFINGTAYHGDCLEVLKSLPEECVDSVITSPPYYQLRDYGFNEQWGLESDYKDYLNKMVSLMSELKRVLKPSGTMWVNLGDTYSSKTKGTGGMNSEKLKIKNNENYQAFRSATKTNIEIMEKSLMLIPHRFAIRCIDELGLILRNDIIWAKPNAMPESVTDRFSKKHEFVFFFVKNKEYYFDLDSVREKHSPSTFIRNKYGKCGYAEGFAKVTPFKPGDFAHPNGKNPGDVSDFWDLPTKPSSAKHFATYNTDLIRKPVLAGSPVGGIILDPFAGTGTTAVAAIQYDRKFLMIEGNKEYYNLMCNNIRNHDLQLKLNFEEVI